MNSDKGHNVFSDIPGFDASKGERIVKALQKLWKKIENLEQIRLSERKSRSKEVLADVTDEDLTITDVQYKLLLLQLQYVRSILRQKLDKRCIVSHPKVLYNQTSYDKNDSPNIELRDFHRNAMSQETQTSSSLIEGWNLQPFCRNAKGTEAQITLDNEVVRPEEPSVCSTSVTAKIPCSSKSSSKPHYHLKLDDVPFILGASSTASHSVVANVQNIIAMMKSHNKALCGPKHHASQLSTANKHHVSQLSAANTVSATGDSQDATKLLNELSQDLYELALKQEKLVKRFDAAQGKNQTSNLTKTFEVDDVKKINKSVNTKNIPPDNMKRCRSASESSIKLQAQVKNFPSVKEKDKYSIQQKQNLTNIRGQPSNPPIMARRKLLRSLQNFKTHLSEEDISWD